MLKKALTPLMPLLLLFFGNSTENCAAQLNAKTVDAASGTLQKMIVETGTATMKLDLNRLNGIGSTTPRFEALRFDVAANSFFSIVVFNDLLRALEPGSMALIPTGVDAPGYSNLPAALDASLKQLAIDKLSSNERFDLAVRDAKTGFTFFNIEGHQYGYDASAQSLGIVGGRLTISRDLANALGRPSDAGSVVGEISVGAAMQPIEVATFASGKPKSIVMPPLNGAMRSEVPTRPAGPDVIVGDLPDVEQLGSAGTQVGLGIATTSCNNGDQPVDWFQLPNTDHPVVPQNLYRMSGGGDNTERFEQIGQSWLKHTFFALEDDACDFGCNISGCDTGVHLCPGCSDPYSANLNGDQTQIGSRAWVNPFTGNFPTTANDHSGHNHNGVSHRVLVEVDDLDTTLNQGASYFAEAQYVAPSEYTWCQAHPGQCNMSNNASYREYSVSGTTNFFFSPWVTQYECSLPSELGQVRR